MCCVMPPCSFSATFVRRIASSSDVLPWSTWPMTVTTGGRSCSWAGSTSPSSSMTSPSTERISRSKLNLSATSLASVGSSRSLTIFMTPSSMSALITSPDLRRIFSASSATVTDSPTRTSSRLTSAGGASTAAGAGRGVSIGAAGRGGAAAAGARGWGGRGDGGGAAGRGGPWVMRGCEKGPDGPRDGREGGGGGVDRSSGRKGTIFGSGLRTPGAAGAGAAAAGFRGSTGDATGATFGGSGAISAAGLTIEGASGAISTGAAGLGLTIVAAGRTSTPSSTPSSTFFLARAGFFGSGRPSGPSSGGAFGLGARLGLASSSGSSRPFPSFTRSSLARF